MNHFSYAWLWSIWAVISSAPSLFAQSSDYQTEPAFGNLIFTDPVAIVTPPGETNRIFILEQRGLITVITNLANPTRTVFMNISSRAVFSGGIDERGILGLAFHPGYATNRYFYVYYTPSGLNRLSRFEISPSNPNLGLEASEVILINQPDDAPNHNGGDLHFGPDGYLYASIGDEGSGFDSLDNSQTITKDFFSSILRLDVDKRPGSLAPNPHPAASDNYAVPPDNPFVNATSFNGQIVNPSAVRTEFYAVGLRNPWRFSFDPATGTIYCGDVGQAAWEEVDIIVSGGNYGWAYREGLHAGPKNAQAPAGFTEIPPIAEYGHVSGQFGGYSITGGRVYHGTQMPELIGHYIFADYASGNIWSLLHEGAITTPLNYLATDAGIAAFGADPRNGELLMADRGDDTIKRLVPRSALLATLVPAGANWKYLDDGSNQQTAWRDLNFEDVLWNSGPAELGYGDGDEARVVSYGPNASSKYITTYFRHAFVVDDPENYLSLTVGLVRDDGGVVYLNGQEVFRSNMPGGTINYTTPASSATSDETSFFTTPVDPSRLLPGRNVLAVEIHQSGGTSSDMSFNLELTGEILPELTIERQEADVRLSWPYPSPGYILESAAEARNDAVWMAVTEPTSIENGRQQVVISLGEEQRFFRLRR